MLFQIRVKKGRDSGYIYSTFNKISIYSLNRGVVLQNALRSLLARLTNTHAQGKTEGITNWETDHSRIVLDASSWQAEWLTVVRIEWVKPLSNSHGMTTAAFKLTHRVYMHIIGV